METILKPSELINERNTSYENLLSHLKNALQKENKDNNQYVIHVHDRGYSNDFIKKVETDYLNAGWGYASCWKNNSNEIYLSLRYRI